MVGAERMDRQRRLAEWQLNQRPALELVLHRKAWQKTHSQISRHALLDTLNTPQLNGVLQSNFALAQGAFKNLPEHALGFVDDKAQRDMLPRAHEVYRRLLDRCDQRQRLLAKLHYRERVIVTHPVKHPQIDLVGKQRIADAVAVERLQRQAHFRSALLKTLQHPRHFIRQ